MAPKREEKVLKLEYSEAISKEIKAREEEEKAKEESGEKDQIAEGAEGNALPSSEAA